MRRYLTEFIGTFFLTLTIGLTVPVGEPSAPLAIGSVLMVMVYAGFRVSGAHYNPAVTLAVLLRGAMPARDAVPYMLAQTVGAVAAALVVYAILGLTFAPAPGPDVGVTGMVLSELLFTFALALVVLHAATAPGAEGNSYYGLAIGFTVAAGAFAVGSVSGAAFNPAVGLGPMPVDAALGDGGFRYLWLYLVAPFAGGALAAAVFRYQVPEAA